MQPKPWNTLLILILIKASYSFDTALSQLVTIVPVETHLIVLYFSVGVGYQTFTVIKYHQLPTMNLNP